jgi:hypothetical protein
MDMEEWKSKAKEVLQVGPEKCGGSAVGSVKVIDSKLEEERNRMEDESRRQES